MMKARKGRGVNEEAIRVANGGKCFTEGKCKRIGLGLSRCMQAKRS